MKLLSKQTIIGLVDPSEIELIESIRNQIGDSALNEMWIDELRGYSISVLGLKQLNLISDAKINQVLACMSVNYTVIAV